MIVIIYIYKCGILFKMPKIQKTLEIFAEM